MLIFLLSLTDEKNRSKVTELYNKYKEDMCKVARGILARNLNFESEAEEAVQNAFVKIIQNLNRINFERDENSVRSYCIIIVTNEAKNILTREKKLLKVPISESAIPDDEDFVEQLCLKSEYDRVLKVIIALDDLYSVPLHLKFVENLTVKEISKLLGLKPKTVYVRISRGKALLLEALRKENGENE